MPIYEYRCNSCNQVFERLELKIIDIPTSQCPLCFGVGVKIVSRPGIVYTIFDEKAVHKLPDWKKKEKEAEVHDAMVRRNLRLPPPLPHDKGGEIKVYETEFTKDVRRKLEQKSQLDNMP